MERRELIQIIAATAAAGTGAAQESWKPRFFTPEEFRIVEDLCRIILPADAEAGGAVEAGVPRYLDTVALYAIPEAQASWRQGLSELARSDDRGQAVRRLVEKERSPQSELDRFFVRFKAITIEAYFQSDIGKKYLGYRGNNHALTFPGCTDKH